ncbi:hypothetical protein KC322_g4 [Hortaea werneckii]|nr:hypothetical protein KC322_g4 [Hortaea werneckii]
MDETSIGAMSSSLAALDRGKVWHRDGDCAYIYEYLGIYIHSHIISPERRDRCPTGRRSDREEIGNAQVRRHVVHALNDAAWHDNLANLQLRTPPEVATIGQKWEHHSTYHSHPIALPRHWKATVHQRLTTIHLSSIPADRTHPPPTRLLKPVLPIVSHPPPTMVFVDVVRALYDYPANSAEELTISENDILFVLEKSTEDDWWKCKRKAASDDDDEPEGLVPNNYVEKVQPSKAAKALYDYSKQTDEELSFEEGTQLEVYDESDPDWTLVGSRGQYGFAPAIYIETGGAAAAAAASEPDDDSPLASPAPQQRQLAPPPMPSRPSAHDEEPLPGEADYPDPGMAPTPSPEPPSNNPAAALAGIIQQKTGGGGGGSTADRGYASPPLPQRPQYTPEESEEEEAPPPPPRPQSQAMSSPPPTARSPPAMAPSPQPNRYTPNTSYPDPDEIPSSPSGFRIYNIHEMVSHLGKSRKMPTVLGLNISKGVIMISPEKSKDGPSKEWSAEKLTHYSIEGKHVFVELVRPSKSVDFHAGSKDTAQEIVAHLGELAGAVRAEGLREIYTAASGSGSGGLRTGKMLYEFMAQGEDEVSVAVDDEVVVLDDSKSEEWWMVRRLRNGKEGVVPSSYVEVTGTLPRSGGDGVSGLASARSTVEQNRMEEERLTRESAGVGKGSRGSTIPERVPRMRPRANRIWIGEGKIHLHKLNGVKIAVPVSKMAVEDLEYVEDVTGKSLDEDKPLSDIKRRSTQKKNKERESSSARERNGSSAAAGASVQPPQPKKEDEYDWFDFFLSCGVNPQICERYANAFSKDEMGPEILPEVNEQLLRTLGLKEGDILRVMKTLDNKYGRKKGVEGGALPQMVGDQGTGSGAASPSATGGEGGLFSGPGGALRNNTRKGRPAPAVQTNDVVDENAFKSKSPPPPADGKATPLTAAPTGREAKGTADGFEDDAWDVKPARSATPAAAPAAEAAKPATEQPKPPPAAQNDDLSLLAMPLQPQPTAPQQPATSPAPVQSPPAQQQQQPQPTQQQGADQALFDKIAALKPQPTAAPPRQRPAPPPALQQQQTGPLAPPPRAASAPGFQNPQQSGGFAPPPLQPQLTGYMPQPQQGMQTGAYGGYAGMPPQQGNSKATIVLWAGRAGISLRRWFHGRYAGAGRYGDGNGHAAPAAELPTAARQRRADGESLRRPLSRRTPRPVFYSRRWHGPTYRYEYGHGYERHCNRCCRPSRREVWGYGGLVSLSFFFFFFLFSFFPLFSKELRKILLGFKRWGEERGEEGGDGQEEGTGEEGEEEEGRSQVLIGVRWGAFPFSDQIFLEDLLPLPASFFYSISFFAFCPLLAPIWLCMERDVERKDEESKGKPIPLYTHNLRWSFCYATVLYLRLTIRLVHNVFENIQSTYSIARRYLGSMRDEARQAIAPPSTGCPSIHLSINHPTAVTTQSLLYFDHQVFRQNHATPALHLPMTQHHPSLHATLYSGDSTAEGLSTLSVEAQKRAEKDAQKKAAKASATEAKEAEKRATSRIYIKRVERNKRKYVTEVSGLEHFGLDLKKIAKELGKKFATGSSVTKNAGGTGDEITVQGDVSEDIEEWLLEHYEEKIPEDNIELIEDKKKGKGSAAGAGAGA